MEETGLPRRLVPQIPMRLADQGRSLVESATVVQRRQRKAHHKVKTGCSACKVRRHKCDELKPVCSGCVRFSTQCIYLGATRNLEIDSSAHRTSARTISASDPGPRTVLSRSTAGTTNSDLHMNEVELMHQFLNVTIVIRDQRPEMTALAQREAPRLGMIHPFVMRGFLAVGAIHLSRLRPSQQQHYSNLAARNHLSALPDFREALGNLDADNCLALISYSKSLFWCSYSRYETSIDSQLSFTTEDNWLPEWFCLLRGSCVIVVNSKPYLGHLQHMTLPPTQDSFTNSPDHVRLLAAIENILHLSDADLCKQTLAKLVEAFAQSTTANDITFVRNGMSFWVESLAEEYLDLVKSKEPWALVALAHFAILAHRSEALWFMKGKAMVLLLLMIEHLDTAWRYLIQWPCEELGLDLSSIPAGPSLSI